MLGRSTRGTAPGAVLRTGPATAPAVHLKVTPNPQGMKNLPKPYRGAEQTPPPALQPRNRKCLAAFVSFGLLPLVACHKSGFPDVAPGFHEFAYVANAGSDTVSILDLVYLRPDHTLAVGHHPVALIANPLRNEVYVANEGSNTVTVLSVEHNRIESTIAVGRGPAALALSPDGERLFVANSAANSISIVDLHTRREIGSVRTPAPPTSLQAASDARTLVVTSRPAGSVTTFSVTPTHPAPRSTPALTLRSSWANCPGATAPTILQDASKLFVACSTAGTVASFSLAAEPSSWNARQNPTLLTDHMLTLLRVGTDPEHIALKPDGGEIFVSNTGSNSISEIATSTSEVGGTYTITERPGGALVADDDSTLWFSNSASDSLGVYSIDDGRLVNTVRAGSGPDALAFSADQHLLLAANMRSGDVALVRTSGTGSPALFTILPAGNTPAAIVTASFTAR